MTDKLNLDSLWRAIIEVETGHIADPAKRAKARGDYNKTTKTYDAIGIAQIQKGVIADVNERFKLKGAAAYTLADRLSPVKSRELFEKYLIIYGAVFSRKNGGAAPEYEHLARIWNGGPGGYRLKATLGYWNRVKAILVRDGVL